MNAIFVAVALAAEPPAAPAPDAPALAVEAPVAVAPAPPLALQHRTLAVFSGNEIQCRVLGFPIKYRVPDCRTDTRGALARVGPICPDCDAVYEGPLQTVEDSCLELLDREPPTSTAVGLALDAAGGRQLWVPDPGGTWKEAPGLQPGEVPGRWQISVDEAVLKDVPRCHNGVQNLGRLQIVFQFDDAG